ncbi:MAG TPA: M13 family metallopeptidase [Hyphomonadaceae bacterium]|jgi:putative endopeptidase|nr:M13 family metallopeptidase [Hyphomonadaceae bacterium]
MDRRTFFLSAAGIALLTASEGMPAFAQAAKAPKIKPWGFDLAGMDKAVKPGDDFALYNGGTWQKNAKIPGDRTRWGAFDELREQADLDVKALVEATVAKTNKPGTDEQRIADFYTAYIDTAAIEAKGLAPIKPLLDEIEAAPDAAKLAVIAARPGSPVIAPLGWGVGPDAKNPDIYTLSVNQSGLGLPNRTFYSGPTSKPEIIAAYKAHIDKMLSLAGVADSAKKADDILAFEQKLAGYHWLPEALRERDKTYNPRTVAELKTLSPNFPWTPAFEASLVGSAQNVIVRQLDAVGPLGDAWANAPLPTLKAYATYHALRASADVLPKAFDEEQFAFFGKTLNGQPEQRSRDKRAIAALNGAMGEAIGRLYVAKHFPPDSKAKMQALVETMREAYAERISKLSWMSADTKKRAAEKLALFRPKIGYPDKWRDYSAMTIKKGDAYGNSIAAQTFDQRRRFTRLGKKTDREEWGMTPQTVNASYNSVFNEITFPAAILQPPFFDPNADLAVNYGGIGAVIGHEMGHGFDDQGAKSDGHGVLHDWWGADDVARFKTLVDKLADQYSAFEALPGLHVNGRLTLGENIGDNGGMQVAYVAYHKALKGKEAPVLDGFTGDQRFFLGWGQVWRGLVRDEALRVLIATDPHSPAYFRTIAPVRNIDAWYAAFDVKAGQKNYLAPDQRVLIW